MPKAHMAGHVSGDANPYRSCEDGLAVIGCPCGDLRLGRGLQPAETASLGYETPAAFASELQKQWPAPLRPTGSAPQTIASSALMRSKAARL